jgi:hypothetical protein
MKTNKIVKNITGISLSVIAIVMMASCKKSSDVSAAYVQVGQNVAAGSISGAIKGTMQANQIYNVVGDVFINAGDTLAIQPGAQVIFQGAYNFWVKGSLFSVGNSSNPVIFTYKNQQKMDNPSTSIASDPAYIGLWGGLWADTTCNNLVLKWTKLQFGGAAISAAQPPIFGASTGDSYVIFFQNPKGSFIMEDSWLYGATDDAIRLKAGKFSVMRNTFEKGGPTGGDFFNVKGGGVGDCAYNLFIGCATNGPKASNKGQGTASQTNCNFYNNTILNSGYRMIELGRGGSINYEEGARGMAYNNMIVNCRFGLRIVGATQSYLGNALKVADTAHMFYGYTFNYHDSVAGVNQFYPVTPDSSAAGNKGTPTSGLWTKPQSTDIPNMVSLVPSGYYAGAPYNSTAVNALAGQNNPKFVNFPLPEIATPSAIAYASGFDFHIQSSSPAVGKGYTGFAPIAVVKTDANFGATEITAPGMDMGAYQINGKGNQH